MSSTQISEEFTKNLFKILCGIMNMRLKQRNNNPLNNKILNEYLHAIDVCAEPDCELNMLNQL